MKPTDNTIAIILCYLSGLCLAGGVAICIYSELMLAAAAATGAAK